MLLSLSYYVYKNKGNVKLFQVVRKFAHVLKNAYVLILTQEENLVDLTLTFH